MSRSRGKIINREELEVQRKFSSTGKTVEELRAAGLFVGAASEIVEQLGQLCESWVTVTFMLHICRFH
jgi:hypothetical protein